MTSLTGSQQPVNIAKNVTPGSKSILESANLSINGTIFNDSNSNGFMDNGDEAIPGMIIRLMQNETEFTKTFSDEYGQYYFYHLDPGQYTVVEDEVKGWNQISPRGGSYNVTLTNTSVYNLDFGDISISTNQYTALNRSTVNASDDWVPTHQLKQEDTTRKLNGSSRVMNSSGEVVYRIFRRVINSSGEVVASISRDNAYNRVLTYVLNGNISGKWIYANTSQVAAGTTIDTWYGNIVMPNSEGWLFFIDDMPMQSWAHPCRFVHVDMAGAITIMDAYGPPQGLETWDMIAGNVPITQPTKPSISPIQGRPIQLPPCTDPGHCYAVLISGGANLYNNWPRYYSDIQFMYHAINVDYGYPKDHIYVLMSDGTDPADDQIITTGVYANSNPDLDGDGINEVGYSATRANIATVFNNLQTRMGPEDHLFIFTSDHGGPESTPQVGTNVVLNLWNEVITDDQFNSELAKIRTTVPIHITMEQCYGGGFVDDIIPSVPLPTGQERVIATAANAFELSYGDTFSKLWISSVAGHELGGNPVNADANNDGVVTMREAFNYATANDYEPEHPQYSDTPAGIGSKNSLSSCYVNNRDSFGYTVTDSSVPYGPTYNWIEISGDGTEVLPDTDDSTTSVPLGFFFNFYGSSYDQLTISNNGLLFFGSGSTQYWNEPIKASSPHGFIAPFWDDLITRYGGKIYYKTIGTAPNRKLIVEWYNNQHYSSSPNGITFEAILYEGSNNIQFQYLNTAFGASSYDNGLSATVGIENPDGTDGLQYSYNMAAITPNLAILFKCPQSSSQVGLMSFARGSDTDGNLWYRKWDGTSWGGWVGLGGPVTLIDTASIGSNVFAFARGSNADGNLWYRKWDGTSWGGWQSLGGPVTLIDTVSVGSNLYAFARGSTAAGNQLWYRKWDGTSWGGWVGLGGPVTLIDAASVGSNLFVFARGSDADGNLWYRKWDGTSWGGWVGLGGPVTLIDTVSVGSNLYAFARGSTAAGNQLWYRKWDGTSWGGWVGLGGPVTLIDTASIGSNVFAFARGSDADGNLWYRKWDGTSWGGWQSLGGPVTLIDTVSVGSNLYAFARGSTAAGNQLWYRKWDGTSWGGWVGLGGPVTLIDEIPI